MKISAHVAAKLLTAVSDAIVVADADGRIVFANAQAEALFGYSGGELLGASIELLMPEAVRERHAAYRQRYHGAPHARPLVSGLPLKGRRKDGEIFDAEIALTPIEEGPDLLVASTIRDIRVADDSEEYFRNLLEAAPDAMIIVDDEGRISIANNQAETMFGYKRHELLGKPIETLLPQSVREQHVGHRASYMQAPGLRPMGSGMELHGRRADGTTFPVEISLSPVQASSGLFVSSVIRDVTKRKSMEAALIDARQEAERAHKANTAFLAAASHDLRQPVQALSLLNGALRRTVKDPLVRDMVASQQRSLDAMTNLLNSLLDISRLDAGAIQPDMENFPVRRLFDRLAAEFARQARQKFLSFSAHGNGAVIRSDANLLSEIIQNLVSNAIRYTEQGEVTLACRTAGGTLCIEVRDTGIGIPAGQVDEIFREFHQLKGPGTKSEGFGLGLAIVRRLADLLGHDIHVESEPGKGSCFSVAVPLAADQHVLRDESPAAPAEKAPKDGTELVLLVEDDRDVSGAWSLLLQAEGYRVLVAETAGQAEDRVVELEQPPDLIISDYHLLDASNGVQAVTNVRAVFDVEIPAFIVSGDTSKIVQAARHLPNSLILAKPVQGDSLLALAHEATASGRVPDAG